MKTYKVLYVAHDSSLYGANQSLLNLINGLGSDVIPYVLLPGNGPMADELKKRQIEFGIYDFRMNGFFYRTKTDAARFIYKSVTHRVRNYFALNNIKRDLIGQRFDIIHSNSGVVKIGYELSKALSTKHVWHIREFQDSDHGLRLFNSRKSFVHNLQKSDAVICITGAVANHFGIRKYAKILHDSVRADSPVIHYEKDDYFLFCGAIKKEKGIEDAMYAFCEVAQQHPSIRLIIAGSGREEYILELKIALKSFGLADRVSFVGFVTDMTALFSNARALLMCSKNEAMGRVTPESMLLGCPVIGYDSMGTSELISDQLTGFLYKSREELISKMKYVLDNKDLTAQVITRAKKFASQAFLESSYTPRLMKIYSELFKK